MSNAEAIKKPTLFQFILCFFLTNIFLSFLICTNYIDLLPKFYSLTQSFSTTLLLWVLLTISLVAQISLVYLFFSLILMLLAILMPRSIIIKSLSIVVGVVLLFIVIADSIAFRMYHLHYALLGFQVFRAHAFTQVISFSYLEIIWFFVVVITLTLFEVIMTHFVSRYLAKRPRGFKRYQFLLITLLCIVISYSFNFISRHYTEKRFINDKYMFLFIKAMRFIPYYDDIYSLLFHDAYDVYHLKTDDHKILTIKLPKDNFLNYPKHPLHCQLNKKPFNIVFIVIDAWRYDAMNAHATPNIYQFAKQTMQFQNHWSGGNCTQTGLFSLFYGLPAIYWDAFYKHRQGPVLIEQLLKNNYKMGIFASAQLNFPAFDKTIFSRISSTLGDTPGNNSLTRDETLTKRFMHFIDAYDSKQPFFSFLFYDSAHNYCESTKTVQLFQPAVTACNRFILTKYSDPTAYYNRYLNAVYFVDHEIKMVLNTLKQKKLLDNTIVIITADHGEEINDHHSGYWQHASAYTSYQLHTPFLIYWPGYHPGIFNHFTSHYDLVPTLMKEVMQCQNQTEDFTIGNSLFDKKNVTPTLIASGYADHALVTKNHVIRLYENGDYVLEDQFGQALNQTTVSSNSLATAIYHLNEYSR